MTKVYTKIQGNLVAFEVDTSDTDEAIKAVRDELKLRHKATILAVVPKVNKFVLDFDPVI